MASSPPAAADPPLGWGTKASVTWIAHDPDNLVNLRGNAYDVALGAEVNPIGRFMGGYISMYRCKPGQIIGGQDRARANAPTSTASACAAAQRPP